MTLVVWRWLLLSPLNASDTELAAGELASAPASLALDTSISALAQLPYYFVLTRTLGVSGTKRPAPHREAKPMPKGWQRIKKPYQGVGCNPAWLGI
ncbi:hypothetical protein BJX61DRAFT_25401 [Aspergillus egyptiacus]|nr:hypothetical protein BJX61DRAFT_25401 [Aspergillus egyptiacus]